MRKLTIGIMIAIGLLLALTCAASASASYNEINLSLGPTDPTLDPALATDNVSSFVINQLFLGLVRIDAGTGHPVPELARGWTASPTADVFTFTLRSGVTWSDGAPVTAADVRYGILRSLTTEPLTPSATELFIIRSAASYFRDELTAEEMAEVIGIQVLDDTHLRFELTEPAAHFPSILALPVARTMPQWAIEANPQSWTEVGNIVTNGPYYLVSWIHGASLIVDKNPTYFDADNVNINRVQFSIETEAAAWDKYRAGDLDSAIVPADQRDVVKNDPSLQTQLHIAPTGCTIFLGFNITKPPFDNVQVRRAFGAAIERQGVIDALGYVHQPTFTMTPPGTFGYIDGVAEEVGIPYNVDLAQLWLAEAGYPDGLGPSAVTLVYRASPDNHQVVQQILQNWADTLNVTVGLNALGFGPFIDLLSLDPPQVYRLSLCGSRDARMFLYDFIVEFSNYFGGWNDTAYRGALDQAAKTVDLDARKVLYKAAERRLVEDEAILIPLYNGALAMVTRSHLNRTYGYDGLGGYIADWSVGRQVLLPLVMK